MTPQLLNNRYRILQNLATGGFGNTFLAEDTHLPSGRRCVIKQLKPMANAPQMYQQVQQRFGREAATLEQLGEGSAQIPKLYAYFSEGGQFYLVEEWIQGQTLTNKVELQGLLPENTVKEILVSLLPVLDYVHSKQIIHRDVKPDNIIVRQGDGKPVLIDFGAVKESVTAVNSLGKMPLSLVIGTPGFMPPEQAVGKPVYSSDLYSLGLTAIYMLTGKLPQEIQTDPHTGQIIWHQYAGSISPGLVAVLDKAIQPHPRDRYVTAKEMLNALQSSAAPIPATPATQATLAVSPGVQHYAGASPQNVPVITPPYQGGARGVRVGQGNSRQVLLIGSAIAGSLVFAAVVFSLSQRSPEPSPKVASSSLPNSAPPVRELNPSPSPYRSPVKRSKVKSSPVITESPSPAPVQSPDLEPTQSPQPEPARSPEPLFSRSPKPELTPDTNQQSNSVSNSIPAFPVGTSRSTVEATLGRRTRDSRGSYGSTRAVIYHLVPNQIDLGYLYDSSSGRVRQTEASFAESVDSQAMLTTLDGLLNGQTTDYIKQGLQKVQQGRSSYTFTQGSLRGQIVRQNCGFIYISIWEANLHDFDVNTAQRC